MHTSAKRRAADVQAPPPGSVTLFFDESGNPKVKTPEDVVLDAVTVDGSPLILNEQVADPAVVADAAVLFGKDYGGVANPHARLDDGKVIRLQPAFRLRWKEDVVGNPFVDGDEITAALHDLVMVSVVDTESVTINLPDITADSAGGRIGVRAVIDKKTENPGGVILAPGVNDTLEALGDGQVGATTAIAFELESDGVGRWNMAALGVPIVSPYPPP